MRVDRIDAVISRRGNILRQRRLTRWTNGSTSVWTSLRNQVGPSGLKFDQVLEPGAPQS